MRPPPSTLTIPNREKTPGPIWTRCFLLLAEGAGLLHRDGVLLQQGDGVIGQLAGTKAQITGVILAVDEGDAFRSEMLGELGDQHLVAALVIPVRLLDVGNPAICPSTSSIPPSRS